MYFASILIRHVMTGQYFFAINKILVRLVINLNCNSFINFRSIRNCCGYFSCISVWCYNFF